MGGPVAPDQPPERVGDVLQERGRQAAGRRDPERVAVQPGVGGVDPSLLAADADRERPTLGAQLARASPSASTPSSTRIAGLGGGQVADASGARRAAHRAYRAWRISDRNWRSSSTWLPARPGRSGRAAPPGRAARAAGRGPATAPPRGARRWACRPRTCRWRRSRTAARRRTATRSASRPRSARSRGGGASSAARPGRARRARRAGTRGRSRARSETRRTSWPPRAATGT